MRAPPTRTAAARPLPLTEFIRALPKGETHLHIEGALPFELLQKLDPKRHAAPPPFWDPGYRFPTFNAFMDQFVAYCGVYFTAAERYHEAAKRVLATCASQNCRYVETSFHLPTLLHMKDSGREVIRAIRSAAPPGLEVRVFAGMCHNDYHGAGRELIDDAVTWPELDGLDLHGPEDLPLEPWTSVVWERARKAGKFTKAHAGEFMGAAFVDRVIDALRVTRIEHGVRAVESASTVERLRRKGVVLDVCPLSNVKLAVKGISGMRDHPIRRLFDAGVAVTVSSDDPFFIHNSLTEEYEALHGHLSFTRTELATLARTSLGVALVPDAVKAGWIRELDQVPTAS